MAYIFNIIILILLSTLSLSFLPSLGFFDATPILPAFFIIALSYFRKGFEPLLLAGLAGVAFDFFSPYSFGLYVFLFLGAATLVRVMFQEGMKELSFFSYILWSFIVSFSYILAQVIMLSSLGVELSVAFIGPSLLHIAVNMVFAFFLYFGMVWYFDKIKAVENVIKAR